MSLSLSCETLKSELVFNLRACSRKRAGIRPAAGQDRQGGIILILAGERKHAATSRLGVSRTAAEACPTFALLCGQDRSPISAITAIEAKVSEASSKVVALRLGFSSESASR